VAQIEVKMIINTNEGMKNVNFFTSVDVMESRSEEHLLDLITREIDLVIFKYEDILSSGYAIAMHNNKELFSFEFIKKEEDKEVQWKNLMMSLVENPTVH
tara:strand:- start:3120 stop:3419 length:300 start_codon:yes stop_codon:yes gene_type:complete